MFDGYADIITIFCENGRVSRLGSLDAGITQPLMKKKMKKMMMGVVVAAVFW